MPADREGRTRIQPSAKPEKKTRAKHRRDKRLGEVKRLGGTMCDVYTHVTRDHLQPTALDTSFSLSSQPHSVEDEWDAQGRSDPKNLPVLRKRLVL